MDGRELGVEFCAWQDRDIVRSKNFVEADRRIAEARRTRAESLDLGDLGLGELPASLGDLPDL